MCCLITWDIKTLVKYIEEISAYYKVNGVIMCALNRRWQPYAFLCKCACSDCAPLPLLTHTALRPTHLHLELWSNPASCSEPLCNAEFCVNTREDFVQAVSDKWLFCRVLVKLYLSGFSSLSTSLCFPLVLAVLSLSPQKPKRFLGSFFQSFYCFLVRHHGISKEQRSLKNYLKRQNGRVDRILVFLCKHGAARLSRRRCPQQGAGLEGSVLACCTGTAVPAPMAADFYGNYMWEQLQETGFKIAFVCMVERSKMWQRIKHFAAYYMYGDMFNVHLP